MSSRRSNEAIEAAETAIEAAQEVLDAKGTVSGSLASYVQQVTGTDTKKLKTAADKGKTMAMALDTAIGAATHTGGNAVPSALANIKAANKYTMDDSKGMTWAEIVVAAGKQLMDRQIAGNTANTTTTVKAVSIAGMTAASVFVDTTYSADTHAVQGTETALTGNGDGYMGILGTVICGGSDCKVTAGKLTGSWYFTPATPTAHYTMAADATTYSLDNMYASYGHWLSAPSGTATVNTYATSATTEPGSWILHTTGTAHKLKDSSAKYSGSAAGRSVHKTLGADGDVEGIESGRFTADVALTAIFAGGTSSISGEVSNFVGTDNPDAVDSSWKVTLSSAAVSGGTMTGGITSDGTGRDTKGANGTWSATSYGTGSADDQSATAVRPTGIYGGFKANFTDGRVAGAYATRKD